jgi:hydroxyacylglutathione hydrolase
LNHFTVVDTRPAELFAAGHIPGSINIPVGSAFTNWAGWFLSYERPFYLISSGQNALEAAIDLMTIGLDNLAGYFDLDVLENWGDLQCYQMVAAPELAEVIAQKDVTLVDVRNQTEWEEGHIPQATHIMLGYLPQSIAEIPLKNGRPVVLQCRSGARSAIAASILQAQGIENVINMEGGINLWEANKLPII